MTTTNTSRWLIIVTIMFVAILEVLDSTIVNVALPSMMPSLGADQSQITWVLTSYVVASAVILPLTGFLTARFGQRRLLFINITGFMLSSVLCGIATSLPEMVILRLMQGAFGATLIPLSQAILRQSFPLEEQGKAMAIWGLGIMAAPVFGPTLGGFITEYASWRWIFYINGPLCLLALFMTYLAVPQTKTEKQKIDYFGIALMFAGIGALQVFLDTGNSHSWFSSNYIVMMMVAFIICITFFLWRCLSLRKPVINLRLFKDRNFSLSCIALTIFAGAMFGGLTLLPILLETLFHYTSMLAGLTMSPMGLASAVGMVIAAQLMNRINVKYLLVTGIISCAFASFKIAALSLNATQGDFLTACAFEGFGMGLFMVPLATYALATIAKPAITEASGLFSYARMLGTSLGISLLSTIVSREAQINWNQLGANISIFNDNLRLWAQQAKMHLSSPITHAVLQEQLGRQAMMIAFIDAFWLIGIAFLILVPVVLLMKNISLSGKEEVAH